MKKQSFTAEHHRIATRGDLIFCIALACMIPAAFALLIKYTGISPLYAAMPIAIIYLLAVSVWAAFRRKTTSANVPSVLDSLTNSEFGAVLTSLSSPTFLLDDEGFLIWANDAFLEKVYGDGLAVGTHVSDIFDSSMMRTETIKTENEADGEETEHTELVLKIGTSSFICESVPAVFEKKNYKFVLLCECTDREFWRDLYRREREVVAYVAIDNIDETLQSVQEQFHAKALDVERLVREWVEKMQGVFRAYERNRYMIFFSTEALKEACRQRFDILDRVRTVRVGDGLPITISVGVSDIKGTLAERDRAAQMALDMALLRGGDQAAYKSDDGVSFYGGKTKTGFKRANIRARVVANQLAAYMVRSDHVLIMGHRFGDFDSFGSAIGLAHFAMACNVNVHIVANLRDKNLAQCFEKIADVEQYKGIFVDAAESLDMMNANTLLVVTDVNNFNHAESPETVARAERIVVIDHHRKTAEFDEKVLLEYIEPSASSASELVSEMIQQHLPPNSLSQTEAEILLSGILLDTKQFTRNTGSRTFSVASFLRSAGANLSNAGELFKSELDDLVKEARFNTNVVLYRDRIALSTCEGETDASYRVVAAKAADKLLNLRGVDAAFSLVMIDGAIHISARSNGNVNVQLILEKLNGGGHYDVAGAQVADMTMQEVLTALRSSIDAQLDAD